MADPLAQPTDAADATRAAPAESRGAQLAVAAATATPDPEAATPAPPEARGVATAGARVAALRERIAAVEETLTAAKAALAANDEARLGLQRRQIVDGDASGDHELAALHQKAPGLKATVEDIERLLAELRRHLAAAESDAAEERKAATRCEMFHRLDLRLELVRQAEAALGRAIEALRAAEHEGQAIVALWRDVHRTDAPAGQMLRAPSELDLQATAIRVAEFIQHRSAGADLMRVKHLPALHGAAGPTTSLLAAEAAAHRAFKR